MNTENCILCPAYQKFFSALNNLDMFCIKKDLIENISHLDSFFSEFRTITFVLQKSISNKEPYSSLYKTLRDKYLINNDCKWLLNTRNSTQKEKPFSLLKKITLSIYLHGTTKKHSFEYTLRNEIEYSTMLENLTNKLILLNDVEIFFSLKFDFYNEDKVDDTYLIKIINGIYHIDEFLSEFKCKTNNFCDICEKYKLKILKLKQLLLNNEIQNILFNRDCVFYCKDKKLEIGQVAITSFNNSSIKSNIAVLLEKIPNPTNDPFISFCIMHIFCYQNTHEIMPTFFIIYEDNTYEIKNIVFTVKSTLYRTIDELSLKILKSNIKSIYYIGEIYTYEYYDYNLLREPYKDRIKKSTKESLFMLSMKKNEVKSYFFDKDKINDMKYVCNVLKNHIKNIKNTEEAMGFTSIIYAFNNKK